MNSSKLKLETTDSSDNSTDFRMNYRHWIVFLVIFTEVIGFTMVYPILPYIGYDLGLNELEIGLVGSIFSLCQLFSSPIIGKLSDRYGRRPLLLFSQFSTLLGFLFLASAAMFQSLALLVIARVTDGLLGSNMTLSQAILADITPKEHRTEVYGYSSGVFGAGLIVGPMVGGLLSTINYAVPMFFAAGISLVSLVLIFFFIPETNASQADSISLKFGDIIPIKETRRYAKDERTSRYLILFFLYNFSFMLFINNFTLFIEITYSVGADINAYYRSWIGILRVILQFLLIKRILNAIGEEKALRSSVLAMVIAMVGLMFSWNQWVVYVPLIFLAYGTGIARPIMTSRLTKSVSHKESATILGINNALSSIGQIVTPLAGGAILLYLPPQVLTFLSAIGFIVTFLMVIRCPADKRAAYGCEPGPMMPEDIE